MGNDILMHEKSIRRSVEGDLGNTVVFGVTVSEPQESNMFAVRTHH